MVKWFATLGIEAYGKPTAPGVYVETSGGEAKLAALGLNVRGRCTYHGLAVNVAMNLAPFADIDPCGYPALAVAQLRTWALRARSRRGWRTGAVPCGTPSPS